MANKEINASASVSISDEVGCSIKRGATGRVVDTLTREQWQCEALVLEWLDAEHDDEGHAGRALVFEALRHAKTVSAGPCFRARDFDAGVYPRAATEIGPSPYRRANRYNRDGESALYLCTTAQGLRAEMSCYAEPGKVWFFANYGAISADLKIADFTDLDLPVAAHHAFDRAERLVAGEAGQRLADLARLLGFDGMLVPGVRGSPTNRYSNLVIFRHDHWESWVDRNEVPLLLF